MTTPLVLHVGLPKTATTTLQRALFARHPEVYFLGKIVSNKNPNPKRCLDETTYRVLENLLWKVDAPLDSEATRALLSEELLPKVPEGKVLVASWEELGHRTTARFEEMVCRVKAVFGSCRLFYTLRNPLQQLPSEYLQNLKGHFIKREKPWMGGRSYMDIETWYSRRFETKAHFAPMLNYAECIRVAREQLGNENVGVFLFEELRENPSEYYEKICNFSGIDVNTGTDLAKEEHLHARLSQAQVQLMQQIDSSLWQRCRIRMVSERFRRRLFAKEAAGPAARAELTRTLAEIVADGSREGHRWLSSELGLPLDRYGYPL